MHTHLPIPSYPWANALDRYKVSCWVPEVGWTSACNKERKQESKMQVHKSLKTTLTLTKIQIKWIKLHHTFITNKSSMQYAYCWVIPSVINRVLKPGLLTILSNNIADINTDTFCQKYRRYRYRYVHKKLPRYFCRYFYQYFLLM